MSYTRYIPKVFLIVMETESVIFRGLSRKFLIKSGLEWMLSGSAQYTNRRRRIMDMTFQIMKVSIRDLVLWMT